MGIEIIPRSVGLLMKQSAVGCHSTITIIVTIQIFGTTTGGIDVLTQPFDYPVSFCSGCLVYCPPGVDTDTATLGCQCDCNNGAVDTGEIPCLPGQDAPLDCRLRPGCVQGS
jgi:hypothetical protein